MSQHCTGLGTPAAERIALFYTQTYGGQLATCLFSTPFSGLLGLLIAGKGKRWQGFLYGAVARLLMCPISSGIAAHQGTDPMLRAAISSTLTLAAPIAAALWLRKKSR